LVYSIRWCAHIWQLKVLKYAFQLLFHGDLLLCRKATDVESTVNRVDTERELICFTLEMVADQIKDDLAKVFRTYLLFEPFVNKGFIAEAKISLNALDKVGRKRLNGLSEEY
jgi:hypothetical protein